MGGWGFWNSATLLCSNTPQHRLYIDDLIAYPLTKLMGIVVLVEVEGLSVVLTKSIMRKQRTSAGRVRYRFGSKYSGFRIDW